MLNYNWTIYKSPLAIIKFVEFLVTICAFSSVGTFSVTTSYISTLQNDCRPTVITLAYPFNFGSDIPQLYNNSCGINNQMVDHPLIGNDFGSSAKYFVFLSVVSFLYVIAALMVYFLLWQVYERDNRFRIYDLFVHSLLTFLWLFAAVSWAFSAAGVNNVANAETFMAQVGRLDLGCMKGDQNMCVFTPSSWGFGALNFGAFCGFVCLVLFGANTWLVYKEWFRSRITATPGIGGANGGLTANVAPIQQGEIKQPV